MTDSHDAAILAATEALLAALLTALQGEAAVRQGAPFPPNPFRAVAEEEVASRGF